MKQDMKNGFFVLGICAFLLVMGFLTATLNNSGMSTTTSLMDANCQSLFNSVQSGFGKTCGQSGYSYTADINKDKLININDFSLFKAAYKTSGWCAARLADKTNPCIPA